MRGVISIKQLLNLDLLRTCPRYAIKRHITHVFRYKAYIENKKSLLLCFRKGMLLQQTVLKKELSFLKSAFMHKQHAQFKLVCGTHSKIIADIMFMMSK